MLSAYITAAMHRATYELLPDDEGFVGVIPGLQGVLGHAETLEASRDELQSVLEAWILVRLRRGLRGGRVHRARLAGHRALVGGAGRYRFACRSGEVAASRSGSCARLAR